MIALLLACLLGAHPADSLSILFVGNSHTYVNNVPMLVESIAAAAGRKAVTYSSTVGGYSLMEHAVYQPTLDKIQEGGWDYVVLQEQSVIPTIPYWRDSGMYPASRLLDSLIRAHAEKTAFYMTWGWKYGGAHTYRDSSSPNFATYFEMQDTVTVAYQRIAAELGATLCPVGLAFRLARSLDSLVDLWQEDYCHATLKGSYLGACVFYAKLFGANPVGLRFFAGLDSADALWLQDIAWQTVSGIAERRSTPDASRFMLEATPNPFSSHTRIRLKPQASSPKPVTLRVYDASGCLVRSVFGIRASSFPLDLRVLPSGAYFVRLDASGQHASARIVLQR